MKSKQILASILCAASIISGQSQVKVYVDLNKGAWFPLDKTKMAIFQESDHVPGETQQGLLEQHPELNISSYRMLISQGRETRSFNTPEQFKQGANGVEVSLCSGLESIVSSMQQRRIMPVITIFDIPAMFRNNPDDHHRLMPQDVSQYCEAFGRYVKLFRDNDLTTLWEMWNEPNLGIFLGNKDDGKSYMRFYESMVPAVRKMDPDACIVGPSPASPTQSNNKEVLFDAFFNSLDKDPSLAPDYFSFHYYGSVRPDIGWNLPPEVDMARDYLGNKYNDVPLMITEYEHYPAGDGAKADVERAKRETPVGAAAMLSDMFYLSEQVDFEYIHWNRLVRNGKGRSGGFFGPDLQPMAQYYAHKAFDAMPLDRVHLTNKSRKFDAVASADQNRAAVIFWSEEKLAEEISLQIDGLFDGADQAKVSRFVSTAKSPKGEWSSEMISIDELADLELVAPGLMLVEVAKDYDAKPVVANGLQDVRWLRNYRLCDRTRSGALTGNYALPNIKQSAVQLGTRKAGSIVAGGFQIKNTPSQLTLTQKLIMTDAAPNVAVKIVYESEGAEDYSVVLAPKKSLCGVADALPWEMPKSEFKGAIPSDGTLDFDKFAPAGWAQSLRKVSILFVAEGADKDSQVLLELNK